ncbi:cytochrome P450 6d5 isoform 1-T1 [Glossina fuscipes fuscipes]
MFIYLIILFCTFLLYYARWHYRHWERLGFPYVKAKGPLGVLDSVLRTRQKSFGMAIYDAYKQSSEKILGIYIINRPAVLIRDAQLARDILTKDFISFHDRGVYVDEENDPMSGGLFFLKGTKWKTLRAKLTPSYSSGKLKSMFSTIQDVSQKLVNYLDSELPEDGSSRRVELKHLFATYAIDIIASVIFGLEVNSFENPTNEFVALSKHINGSSYIAMLRGTCQFMFPSLEKFFQSLGWSEKASDFMNKIVKETVCYREQNNVERKDMLQILLQLRNTGKINTDDDDGHVNAQLWSAQKTKEALEWMTVDVIAAQLYLFYIAGFETTASTSAFTLYELARYPKLLQKAQQDVEKAVEQHSSLTYDALKDMKYLDLCIKETIRKYPALPILNRECTNDYQLPNSELVIKKGTPVIISLFGIHRDAKYFPEPLRYNPERFSEENPTFDSIAYMPFGEGPRHCIAQRMGLINVKVAIAQILQRFKVEINENMKEIEIDNFGVPIMAKGGVNIFLAKKLNTISK